MMVLAWRKGNIKRETDLKEKIMVSILDLLNSGNLKITHGDPQDITGYTSRILNYQ